MAHRSIRVPLVLALILAAVGSSNGQMERGKLDRLTGEADLIAVGKVAGVKSAWDRSRIVTTVTLKVGEFLKGNGEATLTITTPGGEVGGVGEWYSHTATFRENEEVVLFVKRDRGGALRVSGGDEGKVRIERDASTGAPLVHGIRPLADFKNDVAAALQSRNPR